MKRIIREIRDLKEELENEPKRYCMDDILERLDDLEELTNEIIDEME